MLPASAGFVFCYFCLMANKRNFLTAVAEYTESCGFRSENSISAPFSIIVSFDIIIKIKICAAAAAKTI